MNDLLHIKKISTNMAARCKYDEVVKKKKKDGLCEECGRHVREELGETVRGKGDDVGNRRHKAGQRMHSPDS